MRHLLSHFFSFKMLSSALVLHVIHMAQNIWQIYSEKCIPFKATVEGYVSYRPMLSRK